jgi:hypothetical protein
VVVHADRTGVESEKIVSDSFEAVKPGNKQSQVGTGAKDFGRRMICRLPSSFLHQEFGYGWINGNMISQLLL